VSSSSSDRSDADETQAEPTEGEAKPESTSVNAQLSGQVALVTGATRGAGRAIARELASAGATVVVTGRSSRERGRSEMDRAETIEETADLIRDAGGRAEAFVVDHSDVAEVRALVDGIRADHRRLDVLVNDIWGGDPLVTWGRPFWEHDLEKSLRAVRNTIESHVITSWHAAPLMIDSGGRLIVEVTDGTSGAYRGSLFYDLAKHAVNRLARAQAEELRPHGIAAVAVSPGFLRSEAMLDHFGVTRETWRDAVAQDEHFAASETPHFVARGIVALAADDDVMRFTGQALGSWDLADTYGVTDIDGSTPHWGNYFREVVEPRMRAQ
jgi:NAD(P)-dependent dehydrogenase (short-subunit alcohol dehydrogenase family)